ncbi:Methionine ABC transporter substrate-binding protein [Paraburkholderia caribensis]|jgi:D-methionine transport system substrate-binding protein|nr:methionine-binding protein [Paraburkholderia terrae]CAG9269986.1 Methionine ABC transporter substrate-binding protein [Paraburkholderia caribensis]
MRRLVLLARFATAAACSMLMFSVNAAHAADDPAAKAQQTLRIGFVPGPYADEFRQGVEPQLVRKGYTVRYVEFSTGLEANHAVYSGEITADVMQHSVYLKSYNDRNGTDLVPVVQVPTPPMGLYSTKHRSLAEVKRGTTVAVPNDPVNLERALKILQNIGWIRIRANPNPVDVTERDVIANPAGIRIVPLESAQAPRALEDVDYAAIQGNFAIASGHRLADALALEQMTSPYVNQVVVKAANRNSRATADIVAAYQSDEFRHAILGNRVYDGFRLPDYFHR